MDQLFRLESEDDDVLDDDAEDEYDDEDEDDDEDEEEEPEEGTWQVSRAGSLDFSEGNSL
jgi:hypothetical protein